MSKKKIQRIPQHMLNIHRADGTQLKVGSETPPPVNSQQAGFKYGYQAGYRIAKQNIENNQHIVGHLHENSAIAIDDDTMIQRARDGFRNSTDWKRAANILCDVVVGTGIQCFADPIDYSFGLDFLLNDQKDFIDEKVVEALSYALEADQKFQDWSNDIECVDSQGRRTFGQMQYGALRDTALVGSSIIMFTLVDRGPKKCPLSLRYYEKEQIDRTRDRSASRGKNRVVNGFMIDKNGKELGVFIYDSHPHDSFGTYTPGSYKSKFVPASRYIHLFKPERADQYEGFTWFSTLGNRVIEKERYLEAEIRAAVRAAMQLISYKTANPGGVEFDFESNDYSDPNNPDSPALSYDPYAYKIGTDEEIEIIKTDRPNANAGEFLSEMELNTAKSVGVSYPTFSGRFAGHTYEAVRAALQLEKKQLDPIQSLIAFNLVCPIRRLWNRLAVASREIGSVSVTQYNREISRFNRYDSVGPGRIMANPAKEIDALISKLRSGLTTYKLACMEMGLHWIQTMRQIAIESRLAKSLGIMLDFSKGNGGNLALQQQEAEEEKDEKTDSKTE